MFREKEKREAAAERVQTNHARFSGYFPPIFDEITRKSSRRGESSSMEEMKLTIPLQVDAITCGGILSGPSGDGSEPRLTA